MVIKESQKQFLAIVSLVLVGFLLYANSFGNRMFWDDDDNILKNQYVKDWQYFPRYFSENLIAGAGLMSNYWRPMLLTVFSLEWKLWGPWPPGWHFVNTAFHVANAVLLFWIIFQLLKSRRIAFLTSLIFLVHPLQTEAVTYVSGLADPLSAFFVLLAVLFYLKFRNGRERSNFWFSVLLYVFALLAKEIAIILPGLLLAIEFLFFKKEIKRLWPFLLVALAYVILRATLLNFGGTFNLYQEENIFTSNFSVRLFTFFKVLLTYFGLLFWPVGLHMERTIALGRSWSEPGVILGSALLFLLLAAGLAGKKKPLVSFGIFWFLAGLFPTSNLLIPVSGLLYEHWLYLPLAGIFLVLAWLGQLLAEKQRFFRLPLLAGLAVFLLFLGRQTVARNADWQNPVTFYNQTLKYAPWSYRVVNNLGMAYADAKDFTRAEETYRRAIVLDPTNPVAWHNLGNLDKATGQKEQAAANFEKAIGLNPRFFFSYSALADLYLEEKDYPEALKILQRYQAQFTEDRQIEAVIFRVKQLIDANP